MKTVHVAAGIIRQGNAVLAAQRGYGDFKDSREFPGGKVEPGERPEDACTREIREELSVEVTLGERLCRVEYDYPDFHLTMDCFWCAITQGEIHDTEHESLRWLTKDQLWDVEWLPADLDIIKQIERLP